MSVGVIYTGGTIGSLPIDPRNPLSPLAPASWADLKSRVPGIGQLLTEFKLELETYEFSPPLDSSNMQPHHWMEIAQAIEKNYDRCEGFVILHGTDTMTYTASALSFILENLSKPVVITGSQIPVGKARSDALQNLLTALCIAAPKSTGLPNVPEVCILFENKLLRGNRSKKVHASGFDAFQTPNFPPLGTVGEQIVINEQLIRKTPTQRFYINTAWNADVASLDIFPGMKPEFLRAVQGMPGGLKGLVLKTYGTGNAPTDDLFLNAVEELVRSGVVLVDVTQCLAGFVEIGLYETSAELLNRGMVSGLDMTPEAALCKLSYLLGQGYPTKDVARYMQQDQRGEQSKNIFDVDFEQGEAKPVSKMAPRQIPGVLDKSKIRNAVIRMQDVKGWKSSNDEVRVRLFLNLPSANFETPLSVPQAVGEAVLKASGQGRNLWFEATKVAETVLDPKRAMAVTVITDGDRVIWRRLLVSIYAEV